MAIEKNDLFSSKTGSKYPLIASTETQPKTFAAAAGDPTLSVGHPVVFNTSTGYWEPLDGDGTNGTDTIKGFIYPSPATLHATSETIHNVMLQGEVHYPSILELLGCSDSTPAGEIDATIAQFKAAMQTDCRQLGISVQGVEGVR